MKQKNAENHCYPVTKVTFSVALVLIFFLDDCFKSSFFSAVKCDLSFQHELYSVLISLVS